MIVVEQWSWLVIIKRLRDQLVALRGLAELLVDRLCCNLILRARLEVINVHFFDKRVELLVRFLRSRHAAVVVAAAVHGYDVHNDLLGLIADLYHMRDVAQQFW